MPSASIALHSRRTLSTITTVFEALMLTTTFIKCSRMHTRKNSMHDSTMPSGVSP